MGNKRIDLGRSVYALCTEYPELLEVMKDLGFKDIVMPGMLSTAGGILGLKILSHPVCFPPPEGS